jgi:hypothetical protein
MSWLKQVIEWFNRARTSSTARTKGFCEQFWQGHVLADKGDYKGAIDCFRAVPQSAQESEAAMFNRAVLLTRLGYSHSWAQPLYTFRQYRWPLGKIVWAANGQYQSRTLGRVGPI